jgi:hypothetical protein
MEGGRTMQARRQIGFTLLLVFALLSVITCVYSQSTTIQLISHETAIGKPYPYQEIGAGVGTPIISPDGRHVAFSSIRAIRVGEPKRFTVVDGVEAKGYDGFVGESPLKFSSPKVVYGVVMRGIAEEYLRIEVEIVDK